MPTGNNSLTDLLGILSVLVLVAANGFFVAAEFFPGCCSRKPGG